MDSSSTHQSKLHPHQKPLMMKHFLHAASTASVRFLLAAWVGAAVLFVITSVAEQTSEHFDSLIRDQLATIRFPLYYQFGFACLFGALIACIVSIVTAPTTVRRKWVIVGLLTAISGGLMVADFQWIYHPLMALISPAGQARTPEFQSLHNWSRYANQTHIAIALFAAIISCLTTNGQHKNTMSPNEQSVQTS